MNQCHSNGWLYRKVTVRSVATLVSYGTLWSRSPKNYCEARRTLKTAKKSGEKGQIIRSGFKKQNSVIEKSDQADKGQIGQFTLRGDFWPKCLLKCKKLKLWNIDSKWRGEWKKMKKKKKFNYKMPYDITQVR